ncbi:hypothetical protein [uncultured phage MedDCM-OCT-S05-C353]|nr:hypothetical protein [uncultured phage MedDCM-OCT-S05-C353]
MAATIDATLKSATANSFVTLAEADAYFETVPSSTNWDDKTDDQKNRALISATRWIDTLNFYGERCDNGQALSWPRNDYHVDRVELVCTSIPNDIKYATYELANALANDTDSITGTTGDTGLYKSVKLGRWKSSTTLLVRLLELLITYSTFILGFSLISALTVWVAVARIKSAL